MARPRPASTHEEPGVKHRCMKCLLAANHLVDTGLGLLLLIYGALISTRYSGGSHLPTFFITFGCLLLLSVLLGVAGLRSAICNRVGLFMSAWLALPLATLYLVSAFYILLERESWMTYMRQHQEELYLTDAAIEALGKAAPGLMVFGLLMCFFECCRFFMVMRMRSDLLAMDEHSRLHSNDSSNVEPLLPRGIGSNIVRDDCGDGGSSSSSDFLPIEEESLHSDPLWWAKSKRTEDGDLSWAKEPSV